MITIENDVIIVDETTNRLEGFRLEDLHKAPVIIVFTDQPEPHMVPVSSETNPVPTKLKSMNKEAPIQVISFEEIQSTLAARS